jgi:O-antigen/teichoic acid export membrane protein
MEQSFFQNISRVSGNNIFNSIFRFATALLIARILGPYGKGVYASLMVIPMMVLSITELGVRRSTIVHLGEKKFNPEQVISVLAFFFLFTSIAGIVVSFLIYQSYDESTLTPVMIILALATIPIRLINRFSTGIFVANEEYRKFTFIRSIPVLLNFVFIILFLLILKMSIEGALIAVVISNLVSATYSLRLLSNTYKISVRFNMKIVKSLLSLGMVYAGAMFLARLNFKIDILILQMLSSSEQVGYYTVGSGFAEKFQTPFALGAVILSSGANNRDQTQVNKNVVALFRISLLYTVAISIVIFLLAPIAVPFLYSEAYQSSVPVVRFILPAVTWLILMKILGNRIASLKKTGYMIWVHIPALLVNVALNFYLIPRYQAMGAVYATNISYLISFIGVLILFKKFTGTSFKELIYFKKDDFYFLRYVKLGRRKRNQGDEPETF